MFSKACLSSEGYNVIIINFLERERELCAGQKLLPYDLFRSEAIHSQTHLISIFSCRQKQQQRGKKPNNNKHMLVSAHRKEINKRGRQSRKIKGKAEDGGGRWNFQQL